MTTTTTGSTPEAASTVPSTAPTTTDAATTTDATASAPTSGSGPVEAPATTRPPAASWPRTTFRHTLHAEWTKLRTLRSTVYSLVAVVLVGAGVAAVFAFASAREYQQAPEFRAAFDPTAVSLNSVVIAQLVVGTLGALAVTSEYATGMVRTSLTVLPHRIRLLAAKSIVIAAVVLVVGVVAGFAAFFSGQYVLGAQDVPRDTLGDPGTLRAVVGVGLYLAAVALLGVALGVLYRSTAAAVATLVSATLLIPVVANLLPASWSEVLVKYWPTTAGTQITTVRYDPAVALAPWDGFALLCATLLVVHAVAVATFRLRDA
ncbi:ABC transporter permease [Allostreptomyces psammosilenae]|uniref:ABC transporter permease n=1 Tax=Allostreptomyces psammosilenae TaxID=1892865 RepID=A0A853A0L7_9ACTN|nr:ABC transporter permease [Allostreptomyces psammosilenae]NYI07919.1 hypothetical protein [Allostreptomyces psammosilenae]